MRHTMQYIICIYNVTLYVYIVKMHIMTFNIWRELDFCCMQTNFKSHVSLFWEEEINTYYSLTFLLANAQELD